MVRECLVDDVEFVSTVKYEESVWMKVWGGRGGGGVRIVHCCVYMPMDSSSVSVIEESYASLKEDALGFKHKGRVVLLGYFNARVGRSTDVEDWESIVNRVAKVEVGEKVVVCGKAVRSWDDEMQR